MDLIRLMMSISMIVWSLPPLRQTKSKLFFYFLLMGFVDPGSHLVAYFTDISGFQTTQIINSFFFIALRNQINNDKLAVTLTLTFLILALLSPYYAMNIGSLIVAFSRFIIFLIFVKNILYSVATTSKLNIFYLMIILEEITIVFKLSATALYSETGIPFFIATSAFQILIGLFFVIFREDRPRLQINLKSV
jgi:hypothetical protein